MKTLLFLLPRLLPIMMLIGGYWYVCEVNENDCSCFGSPKMPDPFTIADGDTLLYASLDGNSFIRFLFSKPKPLVPLEIEQAFPKMAQYLQNNLHRQLRINCAYSPDEKNTTIMPDLGLARAELLKQQLIKLNAPADRIVTASTEVNAPLFVRDYMIGGAGFDFIPNRLLSFTVEKMLQNDSVVVYFEGGSTRFSVPSETKIYLENLRQFLLQNPFATILLTGHTDNSDTDDFNLQLGERRSNLLKNYMVEMGLPSNRIITQSVGEAQPANPNTMEEGRMRNRRVVIRTVNKSTTPATQN